MRSADPIRRAIGCAIVAGTLGGCASVTEPLKAVKEAITPAANAVAAAPAALIAAVQPAEAPVSAAAQRAFDDAARALKAGRTEEAERGFRALTQSNPELGGPHANLGVMHRQAGRLDESVAALERAVSASPQQPLYFNQLGISYREKGQFAKAREAYERAVALDPDYAAAHLNLGILYDLYLRDNTRALAEYDRYIALSAGKDAVVAKWVVDLKNRKPAQSLLTKKEQP